jgi:hypothetical protein
MDLNDKISLVNLRENAKLLRFGNILRNFIFAKIVKKFLFYLTLSVLQRERFRENKYFRKKCPIVSHVADRFSFL